ncbi:TPA: hypothetical protein N0F65_012908 [Lagenidium giganteum]|uniref:Transmembrane protein n=1 Tax=Lagenidium giganteum TaxID=4803 RepID=A0AAV2YUX5_9STRA|nr:TPA: hypothetical protein N0F65_012908 [Lagenidium giganteum]
MLHHGSITTFTKVVPVQPKAADHDHSSITAVPSASQSTHSETLTVSHTAFRNFWIFILLFEFINGVVLVGLSYMYLSAANPDSLIRFLRYNYLYANDQLFLENYATAIGGSFAVLAVWFTWNIIELIGYSVYHRKLSFGPAPLPKQTIKTSPYSKLPWWRALLIFGKDMVMGALTCYHSFGVRGVHFTVGLFIRESIEIALQTAQAYNSSRHISNLLLNQIYGFLIFVNCISTPILQHFYHHTPIMVRFQCMVMDFLIELWWGTVLPIWMLYPFITDFMHPANAPNLAPENATREVQEVLILSLRAYITAVYPFFSALLSLRGMKKLLKLVRTSRSWEDTLVRFKFSFKFLRFRRHKNTENAGKHRTVGDWLYIVSHGMLLLHGMFVLLSSALASGILQREYLRFDCINRLHPWFTSREACVARIVDCAAVGINGTKSELARILNQFDRPSLSNIQFLNCPR